MNDMMADVIRRGTGRRALALGRSDIAGKTGTTNEAHGHLVQRLHAQSRRHRVGRLRPGAPAGRERGGLVTALPIWIHFMREALKGVPEQHRPMPEGLVTLRISPETGTLVSAENPDGVPEIFMISHLPAAADADSGTARGPRGPASSEPMF